MIRPPAEIRRIVYLGTPELAVRPLFALHDAGFEIPLVVSRADKRRGRGGAASPSPVKRAATELGIPVTTDVDAALDVDADLGVVVAFGRLIKPHVLDRLAMVNLHFSLLPRWRGAAPVERAILAGDEITGVCVMELAEGLDTGDVYRVREVPVEDKSLDVLRAELVEVGTELLVSALAEGLGDPVPQRGEPVYAAKIDPDELEIDWSRSAEQVLRLVRLGTAWTRAKGRRLKVLSARPGAPSAGLAPGRIDGVTVGTGSGVVELVEVQPEGKPPRAAAEWANGARLGADERLGDNRG